MQKLTLMEHLDIYVEHCKNHGIDTKEAIWIVPYRIWKHRLLKENNINEILSLLRKKRIKGINIVTSYGIKKIRIWL